MSNSTSNSPNKLIALAALIAAGIGGYFYLSGSDETTAFVPRLTADNPEVVARGKKIYAQTCAACHGTKLEGQPNWQRRNAYGRMPAPPHDATGHTWHHPDETLFATTKYGPAAMTGSNTYKSDMPAYEGTLTDQEIIDVLSYIKSRWPAHIKRRRDAMVAPKN